MATLSKSGVPSLATINPGVEHQPGKGLLAGEAIAAGDLCYIKNDGKIWRSIGTSANAAAKCVGIAAKAADSGQPITIFRGVSFNYGASLTPGASLYVSGTAGAIDDAATTGGTAPVGVVEDATKIFIHGSAY
jgi:hypothetical protein